MAKTKARDTKARAAQGKGQDGKKKAGKHGRKRAPKAGDKRAKKQKRVRGEARLEPGTAAGLVLSGGQDGTSAAPAAIVLAAGKGTRMKSSRSKVLHEVAGRPMIELPIALAREVGCARVVCVLGHQIDEVRAAVDARFGARAVDVAVQAEQLGTGHAVAQALPLLEGVAGPVLILCGDVPLLRAQVLAELVDAARGHLVAFATMTPQSPDGYGRVVRDRRGRVRRIVEHKDASKAERQIGEVNSGLYCVDARFLAEAIDSLRPDNAQGELYLTDIIERAAEAGDPAVTIAAPVEDLLGVNDRVDLARADAILRARIAAAHQRDGVTIARPETVLIDLGVDIESDVEIGPLVHLRGNTRVGTGARIDAGCVVTDSVIGAGVHLKPYTVVSESSVGEGSELGPFAHLRPGSELGRKVKIGNFVETKKARLDDGAKASHLSYLGDAEIGADANIGCGTITCNYDGYTKSRTVIGAGAFIGSDTQLVAPVTVGAGAVIGAGTTVTKDVAPGALAVSRSPQVEIPGWAEKKRKREMAKKAQASS